MAGAPSSASQLLSSSFSPQEFAAGVLEESRNGVRTQAGLHLIQTGEPDRLKRADGPQPFRSANGSEESDALFLTTLRASPFALPAPAPIATTSVLSSRLELGEDTVAKVTVKGISHLDWAPRADILLLAAGDKQGCVSLFNITAAASAPAAADDDEDDGAADGVFVQRPHSEYISGLRWARQGATRLHTISYDGSVRSLDAESATWLQVHASDDEWSAFEPACDGGSAWLGDNEGRLRLLDFRSGQLGAPVAAHGRKVNTLSLRGDMLASASGDNTVKVWDVRKLGGGGKAQCLAELAHGKSVQSAYFAPAGSARLLSTSYDDTLRIWSAEQGGAWAAAVKIKHDNNTGRWLLPFRAVWAADGSAVICGSMKRETEFFSASTGKSLMALKHAELLTAVPSRHAVTGDGAAVAAATASGRVHIWKSRA